MFKNISYIIHRLNNLNDIQSCDKKYGVEFDLRSNNNQIIVQHDYLNQQNDLVIFSDFVEEIKKFAGLKIINLKCEGIEDEVIKIINQHNIKNWAFLDMSMPYFVKYANKIINRQIINFGYENLIVRFSDHEPIEYALSFRNKARFVWIDSFEKFPLNADNFKIFKENNFDIIIVSPELHNKPKEMIDHYIEIILKDQIKPEAICTKYPQYWQDKLANFDRF